MAQTIKYRICDFIFFMVIGTLYAFALSRAVFDATIIDLPDSRLLALCAGFLALFYIALFNRWSIIIVSGAVLVAVAALFFLLRGEMAEAGWYTGFLDLFRELTQFAEGSVPYRERFGEVLSLAVCGALSLLAAVGLRPHFNFYLLAAVGLATLIVPIRMDWGKSDLGIALFLFVFLILLVKKLNLFALAKQPGKGRLNTIYVLAMLPVGLLIAGAAWYLPKPTPSAEGWQAPQNAPRNLMEMADRVLDSMGGGSGRATVIYTEEGGRLGGPQVLNDRVVMEVTCSDRVYLMGTVRDTYTGSAWNLSRTGRDTLDDGGSGVFSTTEYTPEQVAQQNYYQRFYAQPAGTVDVNIGATRTSTLYAPPYRSTLSFAGGAEDVGVEMNPYGALTATGRLAEDAGYTQQFIDWDFQNGYIIGILRGAPALTDLERAELEHYLALPDELPDRVRDLTARITAGQANDYDRLKALEAYLAAFPYTLMPDSVPRGEDFVDYFLFTGQEGYCVYYATAVAVMARTLGIPTRYIEGYAMPQTVSENGAFVVTGQQAHAWVEAYFPGFGWVPFEPTPPNYASLYNEEPPIPEEVALPEETPEPDPPEQPDGQDTPEPDAVPDEDPDDGQNNRPSRPDADTEEPGGAPVLPIILCLLAVALLSTIFVRRMTWVYRARAARLKQLPNREAAHVYYGAILRAAGALGFPVLRGETAHAYAERVGGELLFEDANLTIGGIADLFARAAYSQQDLTDAERAALEQAHRELLGRLRRTNMGKLRYYVNRYILLRL